MSAIFGVIHCNTAAERPVEISCLKRMAASMAHRGRNAEVFFSNKRLGMGTCLWSQEAFKRSDSRQIEFVFQGRSLVVLLDGEIYNALLLRETLEDQDFDFATEDDAEILAALYLAHGPERMFELIRGKFALVLWDETNQTLLFARDPIGQKPLYLYQDDEKIIFSSEIKGILANERISTEINLTAVEDYFIMGAVPGERSIYKNIRKIPPGSYQNLLLRQDGSVVQTPPVTHWKFELCPNEELDQEAWEDEIQTVLADTIAMMKRSQLGSGAFLSGGLDSSIVVALQSRLGCESIPTFSIGFKESAYNELEYAEAISDRFGTVMFQETVEPDAVEEVKNLVECYDEPYSDPSALPTLLVSRLASHHVSVVFSGDGGDECFAGYARQIHDLREDAVRRCMPSFLRKAIFGPLSAIYPKLDFMPRGLRWKTLFQNLALNAPEAYANTLSFCRNPLRQKLLAPLFHTPGFVPSDIQKRFAEAFLSAEGFDTLSGMQMAEISVGLPEAMVKVDRASMMFGLEVRSPFLDTEVLKLAGKIPSEFKIRDGLGKWILRQTFEPQFPSKLKSRPKQGFELPTDVWLRGPLREMFREEVLGNSSKISRWVDLNYARKLQKEHIQGAGNYGGILWSLLILERWMQRWNPTRE
ncbi:MAG: asparagine synthase (glutamine-hydrolyzing) [Planctomycetia bacterium]|nr:asparagine synthase (glutamine-hydrolyzing) [Planctomycetia bacterium]